MRFRRYPSMKGSEVEWIGDMPSHWRLERFKHLFEERNERGFPNEPLLAATQTRGVVRKEDYENRTVMALKDLENLKLVRVGDFVISLRSFEGGIEYAHVQGIISPAYTILRPRNDVVRGYYARLFKSPGFIENLNLYTTGIRDGQNIDYKAFRHSLVPVPPVDEQKAIAEFLDRRVEQLDSLVKKGQLFVERLQEYRQALITQAVTKGLDPNVPMKDSGIPWAGEIPEHWEVSQLRRFLTIRSGDYITNEDLQVESSEEYTVPVVGGNGVLGYTFRSNAVGTNVVIGRVGAQCGNVHVFFGPVWITDNALRITRCSGFDKAYLGLLLQALNLNQYANRTAQPLITGTLVRQQYVPIPPVSEQKRIVSAVERAMQKLDGIARQISAAIDALQEYRQALITAAVTGKIDVRRDQRERTNIQDVC